MVKKVRNLFYSLLLLGIVAVSVFSVVQAATPVVEVLTVKGTVNPVLADYIKRGITAAEKDKAVVCIIQLDTPGGLDTSMRDIIQEMNASTVPTVVYVAPAGARAASAGVFITLASDIAAMAPNTNIGAAHPVSLGGTPTSTEEQKILNDAVAYIKSIAVSHGRNTDWAEQAVTQSVSVTEQEALQLNVIELVSPDLNTLIKQLNGYQVTRISGENITIHTEGATVKYVNMDWAETFLYFIADPNVAYILLSLAALGIFAEIFHPALIFPGIIGAICGVLAFYALGSLPVNIAGILLIILSFGLFIAEIFTSSFGILFTGGIVSFIIGSLILFKGVGVNVSPGIIAVVVILFGGFFAFAVERIVRIHRRRATTGKEELVGNTATARTPLTPEGQVLFRGERWQAFSESGDINAGETVIITKIDGLILHVKKVETSEEVK